MRQRNKAEHGRPNLERGEALFARPAHACMLNQNDSEAATTTQSDAVAHPEQECCASLQRRGVPGAGQYSAMGYALDALRVW